jgi:hypothetical protein
MRSPTRPASLAFLALVAGACSDAGPSNLSQMSFNVATHTAAAATAGASLAVVSTPETFTDGTNTLVLTKVELVMREIELHRAGATTDCSVDTGDDCEELEFGPVLVDLPLGTPGATRSFSVQIAPGSYDKVEFKLHASTSGSDDGFVQANPDLQGHSVRVTGTYNGADFVYTGDFEAEMEFDLNPAIVAGETGATDLTLMVNLDGWFRDQAGALLDPRTANPGQPNQGLVEQKIKSSLEAFEDDDHDGRHDHGGADDGIPHQ